MELIMVAVGVAVGWVVVTWFQARQQYLETRDDIIQEVLRNMITTRLEVHHGLYYLFREDDDSFVAQGQDARELLDHINLRFRGKKFFITEGDPDVIQKLQAQLAQLEDNQPAQA